MNADEHLNGQPQPMPEQVAWVFHHINEHYEEGGSFRQPIYKRFAFDQTAYAVLCGQGVHLSNPLNCARETREVDDALLASYL